MRSDLKAAENYFALREPPTPQKAVVVPSNDDKLPRRELNEDALKRQVFEPTKTQAFVAAALSIPASALFYAAFAAARDTYAANPLSDDAASEQLFRNLLLFVCGAASVSCIIVGSFLFIYALSKKSDES